MPKRWITDLALTVILLPLMGYSLIGEAVHEWLGLAMLALIVLHHTTISGTMSGTRVWTKDGCPFTVRRRPF